MFPRNKPGAVAPQSWCGDGSCRWPNYKRADRVDRAVQRAKDPGPDWQTHDVRVIRSCGNYLDARRCLKKYRSCNTSDLQSAEAIPIKRKPIHLYADSDSDDSEKENPPHKKARGPTTSGTVAPPPPLPRPPSPPPLDSGSPAAERTPSTSQVCRRSCGSACCAAQVHMMGLMENMKRQLDQLLARVDDLGSKTHTTGQQVGATGEPVQFPSTSVEEVEL